MFKNDLILLMPEVYLFCSLTVLLLLGLTYNLKLSDLLRSMSYVVLWVIFNTLLLYNNVFIVEFIGLNFQYSQDNFVYSAKIILMFIFGIVMLLSVDYLKYESIRYYEFYVLSLFVLLGIVLLISCNDLVTLYMLMELQSLGLYLLITFKRYANYAIEAALKYFILGAFASGFFLFGFSVFYGFTGLVNFQDIRLFLYNIGFFFDEISIILFCLFFIFVGILFKLGVAPFHMWLPDVYEGAPTIVTLFFAIIPKLGFMTLLIKLLFTVFYGVIDYLFILIVYSILCSWAVGVLGSLYQTKLKRLLAYSAIGHMGFMMVGIVSNSVEGLQAVMVYLLIYIIMNINIFSVMLSLRSFVYGRLMKLILNLSKISEYHIGLTVSIVLVFFSIAGIPPLAGFYSKFYILYSAMASEFYLLMLFAVIFSVIGTVYYLRVIRVIYFTENFGKYFLIPVSRVYAYIISYTTIFSLLFSLFPGLLFYLTFNMVIFLYI